MNALLATLVEPLRVYRLRYTPILAIYFARGLLGLYAITLMFWKKNELQLSGAEFAILGFWLGVPWTIKMLFGQIIDAKPILGSPRKGYIYLAGSIIACGLFILAGLMGEWPAVMALGSKKALYFIGLLAITVGLVFQDVAADAMTSEMIDTNGTSDDEQRTEAKNIQSLTGVTLLLGGLLGALASGELAGAFASRNSGAVYQPEMVFLIALIAPALSIIGTMFITLSAPPVVPFNRFILWGGIAYAGMVIGFGQFEFSGREELVFAISLVIVVTLIGKLAKECTKEEIRQLIAVGIVVFVCRAMPSAGDPANWWQIDVLGFDEVFMGRLDAIASFFALAGIWIATRHLARYSIYGVLAFVAIAEFILKIPGIAMAYGIHEWTAAHLGFGAQTIAVFNAGATSPFVYVTMVPILALVAMYARHGNAATWFALTASFQNLPLSLGELGTKWLNQIWVVTRTMKSSDGVVTSTANYTHIGTLLSVSAVLALVIPLVALFVLRNRLAEKITVES
jgi:MFS family permease